MQYVSKMKSALVSFNTKAQRIRKDMDYNNREFAVSNAAAANNKLHVQMNEAANAARDAVDAIHAEAREAVKVWATPAGSGIDTADLALLKGDFQLSEDQLDSLLVKHQGNGTMVNAIAKYAKEHGLTPNYIPNAEDKLSVYCSFAESAHRVISNIMGNIGLGDNDIVLAKWADRDNISQRAELVLYGIKEREELTPVPRGEGFNFGFRRLDGR